MARKSTESLCDSGFVAAAADAPAISAISWAPTRNHCRVTHTSLISDNLLLISSTSLSPMGAYEQQGCSLLRPRNAAPSGLLMQRAESCRQWSVGGVRAQILGRFGQMTGLPPPSATLASFRKIRVAVLSKNVRRGWVALRVLSVAQVLQVSHAG
jgi:hypothetical protein